MENRVFTILIICVLISAVLVPTAMAKERVTGVKVFHGEVIVKESINGTLGPWEPFKGASVTLTNLDTLEKAQTYTNQEGKYNTKIKWHGSSKLELCAKLPNANISFPPGHDGLCKIRHYNDHKPEKWNFGFYVGLPIWLPPINPTPIEPPIYIFPGLPPMNFTPIFPGLPLINPTPIEITLCLLETCSIIEGECVCPPLNLTPIPETPPIYILPGLPPMTPV